MTDRARALAGEIQFSPLETERVIGGLVRDGETLLDVELEIYALPAVASPGTPPASAWDVRVYWSRFDITPYLAAELRRRLLDLDEQRFRQSYQSAMHRYVAQLAPLAVILPAGVVDADTAQAAALAKAGVSDLLASLGDRTAGFNGGLHLINFLYREIRLPPASLRNAVAAYAADHSPGDGLWTAEHARLTISAGPSRTIENAPAWKEFRSRGKICYTVRPVLEDPALNEVRALAAAVAEQLTLLEETLAATGPIQAPLAVIRDDLHLIAARVAQANEDVGDVNNIRAVHEGLRQIKLALGLP